LKLIVFDCDGTLVDSQVMIVGAMKQAFLSLGFTAPTSSDVRSIIGLSLDQAIGALDPGNDPAGIAALCEAYKRAFVQLREDTPDKEPLYQGARAFLQDLAQRGDVVLGVATGKSRRGVDVLFEREDLHGYFVTIQTADNSPSKPHPGMIERAMAETGVGADRTVMIGDTSYDMEMAVNAKVRALGVAWGYHPREDLIHAGAHSVADSFSDLASHIEQRSEKDEVVS